MESSRRYLAVLLTTLAVVLLPVAALNLWLGHRNRPGGRITEEASRWQQQTRGVTYSPPLGDNRAFKVFRIHDRGPTINTIVLGSSTLMGLSTPAFPAQIRIYNFAESANPLPSVIAEATWMVEQGPATLRWLVVPIDWALGYAFRSGDAETDLSIAAAREGAPDGPAQFLRRLGDSLRLPRVRHLGEVLLEILRAPDRSQAFREFFVDDSGPEYRCPDGTPARDFDTFFRGTCTGFRFDGSATYGNLERLGPERAAAALSSARAPDSPYSRVLAESAGVLAPALLERLGGLATSLQARGGGMIVLLPPLLPGLERALLAAPRSGAALRRLKTDLGAWAHGAGVVLVDAGASERFGCSAGEFVDPHHAYPECFQKVFRSLPLARARSAPSPS